MSEDDYVFQGDWDTGVVTVTYADGSFTQCNALDVLQDHLTHEAIDAYMRRPTSGVVELCKGDLVWTTDGEPVPCPVAEPHVAIIEKFGPNVHIEPGQDEDGMINGRFL